ncbi:FadR/GntR family transcriptional regulator [Paraburkholderia sp. RL17-337-BIB-A]|uniref:FadR/GntR family transcriptional regulator n=1 Tax=Paraburkholderia sp. RL17-337-BIB-A TaxID=3031636 RepID=UPI0038BA2797
MDSLQLFYPMPEHPVSDPVYTLKEALLSNLRDGRWHPGERLPTERQMSETYAVGRSTVRRALAQMKDMGLITQTVGSGTYVAEDIEQKIPKAAEPQTVVSPAELMDARLIFEPGLIDLVVRNGTPADFAAMEACCVSAEQSKTLEEFERWDAEFHHKIAEAAHNNFMVSVFNLILKVREHGEWGLLKKRSLTPERRLAYQREHRQLLAALKERDAASARDFMVTHLVNVRRNLFDF